MSIASWPLTETFPQSLRVGARIKPNSNIVETSMTTGYPKARRTDTVQYIEVSGSIILKNRADLDVLNAWFHDTIKDGAEEFQWKHPTTGETMMFRLISAPEATHLGGNIFEVPIILREVP